MTKSKTIAAALTALTLATAVVATSGEAQARPRFGTGLGIGLTAGLLVGAAATNAYGYGPGYRECRYVERFDRWGNLRVVKVCSYY